jgi:hypothetical protein
LKNPNIFMTGLIILVCILAYQVISLRQEVISARNSQQLPQINFPSGLSIYGQSTGGTNNDGFWLFKDDEKKIYFFKYDSKKNEITKIQTNLYDQ